MNNSIFILKNQVIYISFKGYIMETSIYYKSLYVCLDIRSKLYERHKKHSAQMKILKMKEKILKEKAE